MSLLGVFLAHKRKYQENEYHLCSTRRLNNPSIKVEKKKNCQCLILYIYFQYIQLWKVEVPGSLDGFFFYKMRTYSNYA